MICPKCKTEVSDNANFCWRCGADLRFRLTLKGRLFLLWMDIKELIAPKSEE